MRDIAVTWQMISASFGDGSDLTLSLVARLLKPNIAKTAIAMQAYDECLANSETERTAAFKTIALEPCNRLHQYQEK
jgi:hypothetical protein